MRDKIFQLVDEQKLLKMDLQSISGIIGGDEVRGLPLLLRRIRIKRRGEHSCKSALKLWLMP